MDDKKLAWVNSQARLWADTKDATPAQQSNNAEKNNSLTKASTNEHIIIEEMNSILQSEKIRTESRSTEDNLYVVLIELEKCKDLANRISREMLSLGTDYDDLPLKEALVKLKNANPGQTSALEAKEKNTTLIHIMDLLESYGKVQSPNDIPDVLVSVLKELEQLKRENSSLKALMKRYESTTSHVLSMHGVLDAPKLEALAHSGAAIDSAVNTNVWLEEPIRLLRNDIAGILQTPSSSEPICSLDAQQTQANIWETVESTRKCLSILLDESKRCRGRIDELEKEISSSANERNEQPKPADEEDTTEIQNVLLQNVVSALPSNLVAQYELDSADFKSPEYQKRFTTALKTYCQEEDKSVFAICSANRSLRRALQLPIDQDDFVRFSVPEAVSEIEKTILLVSSCTAHVKTDEITLQEKVNQAVDELAQLLPIIGTGSLGESKIRVQPPTNDLLEMIYLVRSRVMEWTLSQQKEKLSGAQGRASKARTDEAIKNYGSQLFQLIRESITSLDSDGNTSTTVNLTAEGSSVEFGQLDSFLNELVERVKVLKSKISKTTQSLKNAKTNSEVAAQKNVANQKKLKRITAVVEKICESLKIDIAFAQNATTATEDDELEHSITESNIVNVLKAVESRIAADDNIKARSETESELERLRIVEKKWVSDTVAFKEAMSMILNRLAESGKMMKTSLFMLGTDESAQDDILDDILAKDRANEEDGEDGTERMLAVLLQKYSRWSKRLQETTEDHLYTQRKIVKYFAAVGRFFSSQNKASAVPTEILDENLIDIDTCLMRFADLILPALDVAIRDAETSSGKSDAAVTAEKESQRNKEALTQIAKQSPSDAGLPYDHRLARLYEMVTKIHTIVTSLQRVRYTAVPIGLRPRSSGDTDPIFEETDDSGFVDLDLEKLVRVSATTTTPTEKFSRDSQEGAATSSGSNPQQATYAAQNDELILRVTSQNLDSLYQSLKKFSSNHKMAAIIIQKDVDTLQQTLASMLEKYSELDIEKAFGQDREKLQQLHAVLEDRGSQKGCYFFNRVNGEGTCIWSSAAQEIAVGFNGLIDKLAQRTKMAAGYREILDDVIDMCAMYVNWAERTPLPSSHGIPEDILNNCVRDGGSGGNEETDQTKGDTKSALPPKPTKGQTLTPVDVSGQTNALAPKISHFRRDDVVLKVIAHMFQMAQEAVAEASKLAAQHESVAEASTEELQALRQRAAELEKRLGAVASERDELELERDQFQSEVVIAKAELRRWRRQMSELDTPPAVPQIEEPPSVATPAASDAGLGVSGLERSVPQSTTGVAAPAPAASSIDQDCMRELLSYMKVLSEELHQSSTPAPQQPVDSRQHLYAEHGAGSDLVATPRYPETPQRQASLLRIQRQLQNQLGTPLVVVTPETGYSGGQRGGHARLSTPRRRPASQGHRYSPERYHSGPYEMCETYTRHHHEPLPEDLSETEGYLDVTRPSIQPQGQGSRVEPSISANISRRAQATTRKASVTRQHQMNVRPRTSFRDADRFFDDEVLPVRRAAEVRPAPAPAQANVRRTSRKAATPLRGNAKRQQSGRAVSPNHFGQALNTISEQVNSTQPVTYAAPSSEDAVTHNANLRAAALRRLAEVVSNTHVTRNRSQFY